MIGSKSERGSSMSPMLSALSAILLAFTVRRGSKDWRVRATTRKALFRLGIAAAAFTAAIAPALATEKLSTDGAWWKSMTERDRTSAVIGMLVGYEGGYRDADATGQVPSAFGHGITFGAIESRITAIYAAHPELLTVNVSRFVGCAATLDGDCEPIIKKARTDPGE